VTGALYSVTIGEQMKARLPRQIEQGIAAMEEKLGIQVPPAIREQLTGGAIYDIVMHGSSFGFDADNLLISINKTPPQEIEDVQNFPTVYQQNLAGYSILSIFFIITAIGTAFFDEQEGGTFRRILAAPVHKASFLTGQLAPFVVINLLQVAVLSLMSLILYGTNVGDIPAFVLISLCTALAANGLGLMLVTLFRNRARMESVGIVLVLITTALSGAFVPRFVMGDFVQRVSLIVPQSWAMEAYQDVMVRGAGVMNIAPECGMLLLFTGVFFLIGLLRFRFEGS
jgi:ABC-2 type transport system permease protein